MTTVDEAARATAVVRLREWRPDPNESAEFSDHPHLSGRVGRRR